MRACALNALSYYSFYVINGLKGRVSISCPQQWYHLLAISFKSNIFCKQTTLPPALLWVPAYCKMPPVSPKLWQHILLCSHITTQYTAYTQKTLWCLLSFLFLSHPVSCLSFPFPFHPPLSFIPLSSLSVSSSQYIESLISANLWPWLIWTSLWVACLGRFKLVPKLICAECIPYE